MADIVVPGPISGRKYGFKIKGDAPSVDEQQRIDAILRQREAAFQEEYAAAFGAPVDTGEGSGVGNYVGEIFKGLGRGAIGMAESGLLGAATALPEQYEDPTRDVIRRGAYAIKPQTDFGMEETVGGKFGEALGSFAGLAALSRVSPRAAAGLAVAAGSGEASERARAAGATEAERTQAALLGAPVGAAELLPIKFIKVLGKPATGTIVNRLSRIGATAGVEGVQEAATQIAQNLIAQGIYDPETGTFTGSGESLGYGAGVGGLVQAIVDLLPGRSRTSAAPPPAPPQDAPLPQLREGQVQGELFGDLPLQNAPVTPEIRAVAEQLGLDLGSDQMEMDLSVAPMGTQGDLFAREGTPRIPAPAPTTRIQDDVTRAVSQNPTLLRAIKAIEQTGKPTTKTLQEALGIGYPEAVKTMAELQKIGVVSPAKGGRRTFTIPDSLATPKAADVSPPTVKEKRTEVPKATVTAPTTAGVPSVNEAVAKAVAPEPEPDLAPQPPVGAGPVKSPRRKKAAAMAVPTDIQPEVPRDTPSAEAEPQPAGAGVSSDQQGMGGVARRDGNVSAASGAQAAPEGGLGSDLPVAVDADAGAGSQPNPLTTPRAPAPYDPMSGAAPGAVSGAARQTVPPPVSVPSAAAAAQMTPAVTGAPRMTATADELTLRDAERGLAPMRQVSEVARNSQAQAELDAMWEKRYRKKPDQAELSEEYSVPDISTLDDPTTSEDKQKVLELLKPGTVKKGKRGQAQAANAKMYFSRFRRPIDAIEFMVADSELPTPGKEGKEDGTLPDDTLPKDEAEFFSGMTSTRGKSALQWVEKNLSPETQKKVREFQRQYSKSAKAKIENRATSSLPTSTAVGRRVATSEERLAFEQELEQQAKEQVLEKEAVKEAAQKAARSGVSLGGGTGLSDLLSTTVSSGVGAVPKRALVPVRKTKDLTDALTDRIMQLRANAIPEVLDLETRLHPAITHYIRSNDLGMALRMLEIYAPNPQIKRLAKVLQRYATGTNIRILDDMRDDKDGSRVSGRYDFNSDDQYSMISLDSVRGMNVETFLHEMVHVATAREVFFNQRRLPMRQRLEAIYREAKPYLGNAYGATDFFEFVAEGMSNPYFQRQLSMLNPKGKPFSTFDRVVNEITNFVRRLLGMPPRTMENALDVIDEMVYRVMTSPLDNVGTGALKDVTATPAGTNQFFKRISLDAGSFPERTKEFGREFSDEASGVLANLSWGMKRTVLGFMGMQSVADVAANQGVKGAYDLESALRQFDAASIKSDNEVDGVLQIARKWMDQNPSLKETFDKLVSRSTVEQVDPSLSRANAEKKYGKGSEKMKVYDEMQPDWARVGKSGHDLYTNMRELYRRQYERLRKALEGKIDFVLSDNPEVAAEIKKSIYTKFFDMNQIEPYFPLARSGDYWLEYEVYDPRTNSTEPVKETFETPGARDRAARELETLPGIQKGADGKPIFGVYTSQDLVRQGRTPDSLFVRDTLAILQANMAQSGKDKKTTDAVMEEVTRLFVNALPETSFAKSLQRRKNTRGFIQDSVEALQVKGYSLGRQGVRYAYSNKIRAISDEIAAQAQNEPDTNKIALIEELVSRANFATNPPTGMVERFAQTLNRTAFNFTLGLNFSSAVVNLSSVPVVLYPYLSGRYGTRATTVAIGNAYKMIMNSGIKREIELPSEFEGQKTTTIRAMPSIDNYFILNDKNEFELRPDTPEALRPALQELAPLVDMASKHGQLNRSIYYDSLGVEDFGRARNFFDRFASFSGAMFHQVERANRQVALISSYNLELDRLRNKPRPEERNLTEAQRRTRAAERAIYQTTETNGGATLTNAPRWAQKHIGRVALMFKTYALSMFYMQMKLLKQLTLGSKDPSFTPEDRMVAFKQLVGLNLSTFALAGVAGMPIYGLFSTIADAFFLDDDEENADMVTRRVLGEGFYKGFITDLSGMDISSRVGLTGLLIRENRYNTNPSAEETLVQNLGGPAWSVASQIRRGVNEMYTIMTGGEGELARAFEAMVPAFIGNISKSIRMSAEGGAVDTRRGDVITGDLGTSEILGQALGFRPAEVTLQQDINQMKVRISWNVAEKRSALSRRYYIAYRAGDIEGVQEALEQIRAFNEEMRDTYPDAVIDRKFLERSLKDHQKTSENTQSGVFINPIVRESLSDLEAMYDQGIQLF